MLRTHVMCVYPFNVAYIPPPPPHLILLLLEEGRARARRRMEEIQQKMEKPASVQEGGEVNELRKRDGSHSL